MLYDRIVQNEIKMEADGLFTRAAHKGWLDKRSTTNKWQKRWFVLKNNCLYYFSKPEDDDPRVIIPLEGLLVREGKEREKKKEKKGKVASETCTVMRCVELWRLPNFIFNLFYFNLFDFNLIYLLYFIYLINRSVKSRHRPLLPVLPSILHVFLRSWTPMLAQ
jgi:hypothetical protein